MTISEVTLQSARVAAAAFALGMQIEEVSKDGELRFKPGLMPTTRDSRKGIVLALIAGSLEKAHSAAVELITRDGLDVSPIDLLDDCRKEVACVVGLSSAYVLRLAGALQRHERLGPLAMQQSIGGE